ncbi:MAG TPA: alkaline phosphatase family protein [Candidatus Binataceae bacterium]|nr:alkaline phosphatase family protein [Candidatus Binataceae bacterium]
MAAPTAAETGTPSSGRARHVFIIVLENETFGTSFGANSDAPFLAKELTSKGELLTHYYAIGHYSLDNYIAMVSGQAPTPQTQRDCIHDYQDFAPAAAAADSFGQVKGSGCVYPDSVRTIANQLEAKGLTWGGYMEDMSRDCQHPELNQPDDHVKAKPGDQYVTRHNPFVYFHSLIDHPTCDAHVAPLTHLDADLKSIATTPNLVFITPNLCNDGHDGVSAICVGGHLKSADRFLQQMVPKILGSPAYRQDGMLIITFDEGKLGYDENHTIDPQKTDVTACCKEPTGPNVTMPGIIGPGGGRIGAVILSRYVKPGSRNDTEYNHYALLRGLEDLFGLDHLGYAQDSGLNSFDGVFNQRP